MDHLLKVENARDNNIETFSTFASRSFDLCFSLREEKSQVSVESQLLQVKHAIPIPCRVFGIVPLPSSTRHYSKNNKRYILTAFRIMVLLKVTSYSAS